jgi:hypothetical protein
MAERQKPHDTATELRELIREANGTLKDLRNAIREARQISKTVADEASEVVITEITRHVANARIAYEEVALESEQRLIANFEKLTDRLVDIQSPKVARRTVYQPEENDMMTVIGGRTIGVCLPVDTSKYPRSIVDELPKVSVDHKKMRCGECESRVFVGPVQFMVHDIGAADLLCLRCTAKLMLKEDDSKAPKWQALAQ